MKRLLALALATLMVLSLVACGGGGSTTGSTGSTGATSGGTTETAKKYKEEVVIGNNINMTQWDPHRDTSAQFVWMFNLVYDSLLWLNFETGEFEPRLATSYEYSEGNTVLTLKLRENAYFTNGQQFDSDDVVFTVERMQKALAQGPATTVVNLVKGIEVEAVDQFTVKFKFQSANPDYIYNLAQPYFAMMNRDAFKEGDIEWPEVGVAGFVNGANGGYLVGTGQYKYEEHVDNDHDSLVKRDDGKYWGEDNPTQRITFRLIPEAASRLLALEAGEVDYIYEVPIDDVETVKSNEDLTLLTGDRTGVHYMAWNSSKDGPWQDENFRLAFTKALNREELVIAKNAGYGSPAYSMYNKLQYGYISCEDIHGYDPEEAKALLAKSNYKGEEITMLCISSYKGLALTMVNHLKAVGINAKIQEENNSNMSPLLAADGHDACIYNINFNPNGDDFRRFTGTGFGKHGIDGSPNKDKIMALLDQALVAEGDARKDAYAQVQRLLAEDCFYVPLMTPQSFEGTSADLEGAYWRANAVFDFRNLRVPEN